eukprot:TRINITY_DN23902_c0_g1_i1.p1 TRINITY_DN23902_c0_g1~~TRINITY_DN23902_c0_g1_i1.p1  ORF type:complete len:486 (+),score=112.96 TRINITY_DN23902_c0_g1_i1:218-1459(+)
MSPASGMVSPPVGIPGQSPGAALARGGTPPPGVGPLGGLTPIRDEERVYDVQGEGRLEVQADEGRRYTVTEQGLTQLYQFEDLKMGKEIGKGSQANVRLCKHRQSGELFAIKVVSFGPDLNTHGLQQELGQVAQMSPHPNLVRSFDAYFREGHMFILMEYMHHGSLAHLLDQGGPERKGRPYLQIPDLELSHIMIQVIDGLNSLHSRDILHRDLKPSNILANAKGVIKICDFGVSRMVHSQQMAQTAVGARAYLSPERVRGEEYTKPADVWALGLCCAELAMGDFPWRHLTVFNLCDMISGNKARVEWGSHPAGEQLRDFVGACMEQEASDRASCNQLRDHDFIVKYTAQPVDLAEYLEKIHNRPSPWRARQDAKGRTFYHNPETGQKQWEKPADFDDQASKKTDDDEIMKLT